MCVQKEHGIVHVYIRDSIIMCINYGMTTEQVSRNVIFSVLCFVIF